MTVQELRALLAEALDFHPAILRPAPQTLEEWGPVCAGCGNPEYRIDGYCTTDCRDRFEILLAHRPILDALPALLDVAEATERSHRSHHCDWAGRIGREPGRRTTLRDLRRSRPAGGDTVMRYETMIQALREIRDHDPKTCWGLDERDCLDKVQEIARATLEWVGDIVPVDVDQAYIFFVVNESGSNSQFFTLSAPDYSEARRSAADFCRKNGYRYLFLLSLDAALTAAGVFSMGLIDLSINDH